MRQRSVLEFLLGACCAVLLEFALAQVSVAGSQKAPPTNLHSGSDAPTVKWADASSGPLTLEWARIVAGTAKVVLINPTDGTESIKLNLLEAGNALLKAIPDSIELKPHGIAEVELTRLDQGKDEEPASYNAQLIATDAKGTVTPLRIVIGGSILQAGVTKLTKSTMGPLLFWTPWSVTIDVPVANSIKPARVPAAGSTVGYLRADSGEYVGVQFDEIQQPPILGPQSPKGDDAKAPLLVRLKISDMKSGHFEGDIFFVGGADRKAAMALVVEARDFWIWPTLVIALGIVLAALSKLYVGTFRTIWVLRRQEADLGRQIKEATRSFSESAGDSQYSPLADFENQRVEFRRKLDAFQSWQRSVQDNQAYFGDQLKTLSALQNQISDWAALGQDLAGLKEQIRHAYSVAETADELADTISQPSVLPYARELYIGGPIAGERLSDARTRVSACTTFLVTWLDLVDAVRKTFDRLKDLPPDERTEHSSALKGARDALWNALPGSDLSGVSSTVGTIQAELNSWLESKSAITKSVFERALAADAGVADAEEDEHRKAYAGSAAKAQSTDVGRKRRFATLIQAGDGATFTIGATLAVLTALNTYYIDKPFGTAHDYLSLFLTAAGTKAAVDLFAALVDRFGGIPSGSRGA